MTLIRRITGLVLLSLAATCTAFSAEPNDKPTNTLITNLSCEYLVNPLGIDAKLPRLSWAMESNERAQRQTAWQVLVASSAELLAKDQGDLWDSGKVDGDQSSADRLRRQADDLAASLLVEGAGVGQARAAVAVERRGVLGKWACSTRKIGKRNGSATGGPCPKRNRCCRPPIFANRSDWRSRRSRPGRTSAAWASSSCRSTARKCLGRCAGSQPDRLRQSRFEEDCSIRSTPRGGTAACI